jgi:hypothetical protein
MGNPEPLSIISGQARGCPCPRASYGSERRLDAEAKRTCREPRPWRAEANVQREGMGVPEAGLGAVTPEDHV